MISPENTAKAVTWFMTLPLYIYALIKWRQFNDHFLIKNRFPKLSHALFWIMFMAQSLSAIEGMAHDLRSHSHAIHHQLTLAILSLTFTISGLILYRINLIYIQWKASQSMSVSAIRTPRSSMKQAAENVVETMPSLPIKRKSNKKSIYRSNLAVITLSFVIVCSLVLYVPFVVTLDQNIVYIADTVANFILCALIAASIWNIKHKNVEEGIGCIKECVLILVSLIILMVLETVFPPTQRHLLVEITVFYSLNYQALMILYMPLYLLWQSEGTLNVGVYHTGLNEHIFATDVKKQGAKKDVHKTLDLVGQMSQSRSESTIVVTESLFGFLYHNEMNHNLFSDYLRICFAIENLLFVERVSVFHQIVLELKERSDAAANKLPGLSTANSLPVPTLSATDVSDCVHSEVSSASGTDAKKSGLVEPIPSPHHVSVEMPGDKTSREEIHRLEFRYLTDIYTTYRRVIEGAVDCEDADDERYHINHCKRPLLDICQELYDQFLSVFAATQVNLSYAVQDALDYQLDRARGDGMNKFETYDDFLMLFDDALIETYRLMISAYLFGFRDYIKNKFADAQFS